MGGLCCCLEKSVENGEIIPSSRSTETRNIDIQNSIIVPRNSSTFHGSGGVISEVITCRRPCREKRKEDFQNRNTDPRNSSSINNYNINRGVRDPKIHNSKYFIQENTSIAHRTTDLNIRIEKFDPNYFPALLRLHLFSDSPIYQMWPIFESQDVYWDIKRRITNRYFKVLSIDKIKNDLLETSYLLKKKQKLSSYPNLEELELFHGTKSIYADSICKNNFNWRFSGKEVGHRFGQGVCFSCNAMYAANYSDTETNEKIMFIAKVLIGMKCLGKRNMKLPVAGCDTSTKQSDNIVVVKYDDNEYYPIYRIKYYIAPGYVPMNQRNKKR